MNWKEAVIISTRLTARRTVFTEGKDKITTSIVGYSDGSGYILVAKNGKLILIFHMKPRKKISLTWINMMTGNPIYNIWK